MVINFTTILIHKFNLFHTSLRAGPAIYPRQDNAGTCGDRATINSAGYPLGARQAAGCANDRTFLHSPPSARRGTEGVVHQ